MTQYLKYIFSFSFLYILFNHKPANHSRHNTTKLLRKVFGLWFYNHISLISLMIQLGTKLHRDIVIVG